MCILLHLRSKSVSALTRECSVKKYFSNISLNEIHKNAVEYIEKLVDISIVSSWDMLDTIERKILLDCSIIICGHVYFNVNLTLSTSFDRLLPLPLCFTLKHVLH